MEGLSFNERLKFFKNNPNENSQKVFSYNSLDSESPFKERLNFFNTKLSSNSSRLSSSFDMLCEINEQSNDLSFNENLQFFRTKSDSKSQKLSFTHFYTSPNNIKQSPNANENLESIDASAMTPKESTEEQIHDLSALKKKTSDPKFNTLERRKSLLYTTPRTNNQISDSFYEEISFSSIRNAKKLFEKPSASPLSFTNYYTPFTTDTSSPTKNAGSPPDVIFSNKSKKEYLVGEKNDSFEAIECPLKFNQPLDVPFTHKDKFGQIKIHPMLTTEQKNFKCLPKLDSFSKKLSGLPQREELNVPNARCFILRNFFSLAECDFFIKSCEKLGFTQLSDKFPSGYRINDRILFLDEYIADGMWNRLEPCLSGADALRIRPIGFGNEGKWLPIRLNECIKVMRYNPGGHFSPHFDGPWVPREDESSIYTLLVYLNDDYIGGHTVFLDENNPIKELSVVRPETGVALIFNHDCLHKGEPVLQGTKYLLRTEIMFKRVDTECLPNPQAYQMDANYLNCLTLYCKSWEYEQAGDSKKFTDTYIEAIQSQMANQRSIGLDHKELTQLIIPIDTFLHIFSFLSIKDLVNCMLTCKQWLDIARCGSLWLKLYKRTWPHGFKVDKCLSDPDIQDWYSNYKSHLACLKFKSFAVIDFGSYSVKSAKVRTISKNITYSSIQSYVANINGIHDLHMRRFEYQRIFCGKEALESYPNQCTKLIKKGMIVPDTLALLLEILYGVYIDCKLRPSETPLLCMINESCWNDEIKQKMTKLLIRHFKHPYIMYVEQSVAVCLSNGVRTSFVVKFGAETLSICYVSECKLLNEMTLDHNASNQEIVSKVKEFVLDQFDQDTTCITNLNMYCVGGGLTEDSISELKNLFQEDNTFDNISIIFNGDYLSPLMSGIAYANSLACYLTNMKGSICPEIDNKTSLLDRWYTYLIDTSYWGSHFLRPYDTKYPEDNAYLSSDDNYTPPPKDSECASTQDDDSS